MAMLPEDDRARAREDMHKNLAKIHRYLSGQIDKESKTDREIDQWSQVQLYINYQLTNNQSTEPVIDFEML